MPTTTTSKWQNISNHIISFVYLTESRMETNKMKSSTFCDADKIWTDINLNKQTKNILYEC